ncbi:MAG: DUF2461 domain-containing protein, partial [Thermomicrobiales bacterium]
MPETPTFTGFPPEALDFYTGLLADNSKRYWEANKPIYESKVRGPMLALIETLDEEYRPFRIFRPYRDVRFARDKTPYKTQIGAYSEGQGGCDYYVAVSADGLFVACGYHHPAPDQLARYREAVAGEDGARLPGLISDAQAAELTVEGGMEAALKRVPRGYPADHPRADLLKLKGLIASRDFGAPKWLSTPETSARVQLVWR